MTNKIFGVEDELLALEDEPEPEPPHEIKKQAANKIDDALIRVDVIGLVKLCFLNAQ